MIGAISPPLLRKLAWLTLLLAVSSYLALAIAEQGSAPSGLGVVPSNPLPFARERVFGLDLRGRASVDALNWLNQAGNPSLALVALSVDPEVVRALSVPDQQPLAFSALDLFFAAAPNTPLAVCVHEPPGTVGRLGVAQAVVGALNERYTTTIAYVAGCPGDVVGWRRAVAQAALKDDAAPAGLDNAFIPLTAGAILNVEPAHSSSLARAAANASGGGHFVALAPTPRDTLSARAASDAAGVLRDYAQVALILEQPTPEADPATFAASIASATLTGDEPAVAQGFTGITSPTLRLDGAWQPSVVGAVAYRRAAGEGANLALDVVGTDIYLMGVVSPTGGEAAVWLDPPDGPLPPPTRVVSFEAEQARDAALPLFTGLPATRHRVVLASSGGDITLSGVFVTGHATPGWANGVSAFGLLFVGVAALSVISYGAVLDVRRRAGPPRSRRKQEHPRGFSLRR